MPKALVRFTFAVLGVAALMTSTATAAEPIAVDIFDGIPEKWDWSPPPDGPTESYSIADLGFVRIPLKFNEHGVASDRAGPIAIHATTRLELPAGSHRLLLRSRNAARLLVDGATLAETNKLVRNSSGHEVVPPENVPEDRRRHPLPPSDQQRIITWESDGSPHRIELWAVIGGKGLRNETGELLAAVVAADGLPRLIGSGEVPVSVEGWPAFAQAEHARIDQLDTVHRRIAAAGNQPYWEKRHEHARLVAEKKTLKAPGDSGNLVDRHLNPGGDHGRPANDVAFYRRLALDTIGVIPDPADVAAFLADNAPDKRARAIEARLADPRWADGWMGYWQDVLAENPGLLKPTLNNTGPFRRFLYDAFADNAPLDRFVTNLVRMEGSALGGGPAGFGMATQNDAPMAAKAHVLAKAFLAVDMKCARCHDAPFHPFAQEDLFGLAALLAGKPQAIPATSTVPMQPGGRTPAVSVSLAAGQKIAPLWNLTDIAPEEPEADLMPANPTPRDRLAILLTSPRNTRFAPVIVNRVWQRYMGFGLVEPVDDWDGDVRNRHPELLADLAREFMIHGYDLKHIARVILESKAYQGESRLADDKAPDAPARRRMSAEQLLDSLFAAVGKPFRAEELCLDIDGRRPPTEFLNLGTPTRAWQLALPSNERDRPALTLPVTSSLTDILIGFGWRAARPDPITLREEVTTPLQPALLANGVVVDGRIARLSDDSAITELCLNDQPIEALIQAIYLRVLSRTATDPETRRLAEYIGATYNDRVVPGAKPRPPMKASARRVSWSNHLHPEATTIQMHEEKVVREGDPPTDRLTPAFRERMEDIVWALVNSPEFVFVP